MGAARDEYERELLKQLLAKSPCDAAVDMTRKETRLRKTFGRTGHVYYEVIRAERACLACHPQYSEGELMAIISAQIPK